MLFRSEHDLTEDEVQHEARFEDSIGIFPEFVDGYGVLILPTTGRYFQVPYRNLLPRDLDGLLVAGRATGGDRIAHAATRNMACCVVTGQGAGAAAAEGVRTGRPVRDVDPARIQRTLNHQGVRTG